MMKIGAVRVVVFRQARRLLRSQYAAVYCERWFRDGTVGDYS